MSSWSPLEPLGRWHATIYCTTLYTRKWNFFGIIQKSSTTLHMYMTDSDFYSIYMIQHCFEKEVLKCVKVYRPVKALPPTIVIESSGSSPFHGKVKAFEKGLPPDFPANFSLKPTHGSLKHIVSQENWHIFPVFYCGRYTLKVNCIDFV